MVFRYMDFLAGSVEKVKGIVKHGCPRLAMASEIRELVLESDACHLPTQSDYSEMFEYPAFLSPSVSKRRSISPSIQSASKSHTGINIAHYFP